MSFSLNTPTPPTIPTYPILYKNKSKGKVTKWEIKIIPVYEATTNADADPPATNSTISKYNISVSFGETDGKQQTHNTLIEKGKSNRTIEQQAILEANSKWKEKKERDGYNTSSSLTNVPTTTSTSSATTTPSASSASSAASSLPLSNMCITKFSPMLANTFNDKLYTKTSTSRGYKIPFPAFVQRKYDGIRCISHTNQLKKVIMESRKGLPFHHITHIEFFLKLFFETAGLLLQGQAGEMSPPTNVYFDGELYCTSLPFETINGCVRLTKIFTEEERLNINKLQYHIYDCYLSDKPGASFKERMAFLKRVFERVREEDTTGAFANVIFEVETEEVANMKEMKEKHDEYVQNGFEGIMLRDRDGIYEPNKRSKYLQKYKEFMEEEFEIVGFHDGEGIDKEMVIWDCITKEGRKFSVRPKTNFEERKRLFKEAGMYVGKQLTVVFQEYSHDLIPRFPVGKAIRENV